MPAFATASATRSGVVHLAPVGAPQSWCGRRADQPVTGPIHLAEICRQCWPSAPAEGRRLFQAAARAPEQVG